MFKEKIIQIFEDSVLTNRGRIFKHFTDIKTQKEVWWELELPEFNDTLTKGDTPKGTTQFFDPVTQKEEWDEFQLKDLNV